jgi:hypothetical protein
MTADNTTNTTITLFLAPSSLTSAVQFITKNQFGNPLPNRIQHYLRYFPANNSYQLVAMGTTDADGVYVANIFTNGTTFYKIISFSPNGGTTVEKTWNTEAVYCIAGQSCTHDLTITEETTMPPYWSDYYGLVGYNCIWDLVTQTETCVFADASGNSHTFTLTAWRIGFGNPVEVCNDTAIGASGALLCTIPDATMTDHVYVWRLTRQSDLTIVAQESLDFRVASLKAIGAGIAFLLVVVGGLIALFNPAVGVVVVVVSLAGASVMGLMDISVTALAGLFIMGLILSWRLGRSG